MKIELSAENKILLFKIAFGVALVLIIGGTIGGVYEMCSQTRHDRKFDENINRQLTDAEKSATNANRARDERLIQSGAENRIEAELANKQGDLTDVETNSNNALRRADDARNANLANPSAEQRRRARCIAYPESIGCR